MDEFHGPLIEPDQLRKCATCVYLAAEAGPADDIANHLRLAAGTIEFLRTQLAAQEELTKEMEMRWKMAEEVIGKLSFPPEKVAKMQEQLAAQERELERLERELGDAKFVAGEYLKRLREAEELCKFIGEDRLPCERSGNIDCDCAPCQVTRLAQAYLAPAAPGPELHRVIEGDNHYKDHIIRDMPVFMGTGPEMVPKEGWLKVKAGDKIAVVGPEMVCVRRDDLAFVWKSLINGSDGRECPSPIRTRLKSALEEKP